MKIRSVVLSCLSFAFCANLYAETQVACPSAAIVSQQTATRMPQLDGFCTLRLKKMAFGFQESISIISNGEIYPAYAYRLSSPSSTPLCFNKHVDKSKISIQLETPYASKITGLYTCRYSFVITDKKTKQFGSVVYQQLKQP